jgi:hypothetical protein
MQVNRGLLFWGLGFVTAGLVALAIQAGYLDRSVMAGSWRLWPVILVAIGISLILSRTPLALLGTVVAAVVIGAAIGTVIVVGPGFASDCGESQRAGGALEEHTGTLGERASLDWHLDCGTLEVTMSQESTWHASVGSTGEEGISVDGANDHLNLASANKGGGFFPDRGRERWVVELPGATTFEADIHTNASKGTMDLIGARFSSLALQPNAADLLMKLEGASIEGLDVELNAGSLKITASPNTALSGTIQVNAGSVDLCAPSGTPMRITAGGTAFGTDLGDAGLTQSGDDTWESATYAQAQRRITLTVHGNAASFDLNPSGGCE